MTPQDTIRAMVVLKSDHARLWYELYGLLKVHGPDMSAMYSYPCVFTWTEAIAYAQRLTDQNNHDGVTWLHERCQHVNEAMQARIDAIYQSITSPE